METESVFMGKNKILIQSRCPISEYSITNISKVPNTEVWNYGYSNTEHATKILMVFLSLVQLDW